MDDRTGGLADRRGGFVAGLVWAVAVVVGAVAMAATHDWALAIAWMAALLVADLIPVATPSGGRVSLAIGPAFAMPVLVDDKTAVVAALALGIAASPVASRILGIGQRSGSSYARTLVGFFVLIGVYDLGDVLLDTAGIESRAGTFAILVLAGGAWFVVDTTMRAASALGRFGLARYLWLLAARDWPVAVALMASGALFAFGYPEMGWWALPAATIPYAFSNFAFARYNRARSTYLQMIGGLSQLPEVAGLSAEGHAAGTADLAVAIAQNLGLHPGQVEELNYAALLHDIGRITLSEPAMLEASDGELAAWGAGIVADVGYLGPAATVVAAFPRPYRRPGQGKDATVPLAARILRVAAEYDRSVKGLGLDPVEALEVLYRGSAYDFDPDVVAALRRVLHRRRLID